MLLSVDVCWQTSLHAKECLSGQKLVWASAPLKGLQDQNSLLFPRVRGSEWEPEGLVLCREGKNSGVGFRRLQKESSGGGRTRGPGEREGERERQRKRAHHYYQYFQTFPRHKPYGAHHYLFFSPPLLNEYAKLRNSSTTDKSGNRVMHPFWDGKTKPLQSAFCDIGETKPTAPFLLLSKQVQNVNYLDTKLQTIKHPSTHLTHKIERATTSCNCKKIGSNSYTSCKHLIATN